MSPSSRSGWRIFCSREPSLDPKLRMRRPNLLGLPSVEVPSGYSLGKAGANDAEPLARLLTTAFGEDWTADKARQELLQNADVPTTFIVARAGVIVATASAQVQPVAFPGSGVVHWVAADPAHSGMGLGRAVVTAVLHELLRLGLSDAVLITDDERLPAIAVYSSLGFVPDPFDGSHPQRWATVLTKLLQR